MSKNTYLYKGVCKQREMERARLRDAKHEKHAIYSESLELSSDFNLNLNLSPITSVKTITCDGLKSGSEIKSTCMLVANAVVRSQLQNITTDPTGLREILAVIPPHVAQLMLRQLPYPSSIYNSRQNSDQDVKELPALRV